MYPLLDEKENLMPRGTINGEPYALPDGYRPISDSEYSRLQAAAELLTDLDRCEHGRHIGDVCGGAGGCNGPSHGNPFLATGQRIGTSLAGRPYTVPDFAALRSEHRSAQPADWSGT